VDNASLLHIGLEPYPGYRLRRFLGRGSFGEVWEAYTPDNRTIALKFLPCDSSTRASQETRSIQAIRHLRHPNLVRIENTWCFAGYLVVAMELAQGSLQDLFESHRREFGTPMDPGLLIPLLAQAATALDFLNAPRHRIGGRDVGIQHCDVKPSNLLVFGDTIKVGDFSLTSLNTAPLQAHRRAGTLAFAAPEVFQGRLSDRTDQYALALTYCALRGCRLPSGKTLAALPVQASRPAPDLNGLSLPELRIISRALAPMPMDRWTSCGDLIAQLGKAVLGKRAIISLPQPLAPARALASPEDRRGSVRHACGRRASCRLLGKEDQTAWRAWIKDISERGLGVVSGAPVRLGTILAVRPEDEMLKVFREVYVRVARTVECPEGDWLLGCTLARKLSDAEIRGLAQKKEPGGKTI
jgi:serine/threonine-protein kinase